MKHLRCRLVILAALIVAASACEPPTQPIFYTLETEKPIEEGRGLAQDLHARKIVTSGARYFLAAGSLFTRIPGAAGSAATTWRRIPPPVSGALCTTVEVWDDGGGLKLWAGWYDAVSGAGLGLYSLDATLYAGVVPGWTASDWTADPNVGAPEMVGLLEAPRGTELLVATSSTPGGASVLHYYAAGPAFDTGGPLIASSADPIVDASWDSTNTLYWVVAGTALYAGNSGAALATQAITDITDTGAKFGGVLYEAADDDLYLSTHSGRLLRCNNPTGAQTASSSSAITVDNEAVRFTRFVDVSATTTPGEIYVGSQGYGFYAIENLVTDSKVTVRHPASNLAGLYNGAINAFLLDTSQSPDNLFVCTSGAGLWRGTYVSGSYSVPTVVSSQEVPAWDWNQERETD